MKCCPPGFTFEKEHEWRRSVEGSPTLLSDRPLTPRQVEPVTEPSSLSSGGPQCARAGYGPKLITIFFV